MKPDSFSRVSDRRSPDRESAAFAAWYATHSSVRRLWAVRNSRQLRTLVTLEPPPDDSDAYPAWLANCDAWPGELQLCTDSAVRLELLDEPTFDGAAIDAESVIVTALSWRDPTFT